MTHNGGVNVAFDDELTFVRGASNGPAYGQQLRHAWSPGAPQAATPGIPFND